MARGIRLTKAERDFLKPLLLEETDLGDRKSAALARAVLAKVEAAEEKPRGIDVGPIEDALVTTSRGKVLRLEGGYAQASVRAAQVSATVEDAELVGAYLARTAYFTQPMTILDVFNKWFSWLPKARATQPPPALSPGLGSNAQAERGPGSPGQKTAGGRSSPGFR